jgi:hypothetical protein
LNKQTTVKLTDEEAEIFKRPINGVGGFQDLLRNFQKRITSKNTLTLTSDEIDKLKKYATRYGQGGFEDQLRAIIQALQKAQ